MNKLQWNFIRNSNIFIQENAFESVFCENAAILSRPQCVKVHVEYLTFQVPDTWDLNFVITMPADLLAFLGHQQARRQLKSPQSLSGRSIHLTLVTKWSWSWSWMTHCHLLCAMSIGPPILRYSYFKIWPWKSMVKVMCVVKGQGHIWPSKFKSQGYGQVQTHWSHLRPGVQSICLLFVSWQSDHFWLRYRKFHIWPWKI